MAKEDWDWGPEFLWGEFNDPDSKDEDSGLNMQPDFMDKLLELRKLCGSRIVVHGTSRGGFADGGHADKSSHYLGLAADIHFPDLGVAFASNFIRKINFNGVGFYEHWKPMPGFHVDMGNRRARWLRTSKGLYVSLT